MAEILSITEQTPKNTTLPDGYYVGMWSGSVIIVKYKLKTYGLETAIAVKGINIGVVVEIKDGIATYHELENVSF